MENNIEELRFVADLAHNGGMMQAQNEALKAENLRLQEENMRLRAENDNLREQNAHKDKVIVTKDNRISELEGMLYQADRQPQVVVNQVYFVLSWPKTCNYVSRLDNDGRRFVGHFMHHTLPDGTPMSVIEQVDEMTRLEGNPENRLADEIEKLAKKPTTQNNFGPIGNYNEKVDEQNNTFPMPPLDEDEPLELPE